MGMAFSLPPQERELTQSLRALGQDELPVRSEVVLADFDMKVGLAWRGEMLLRSIDLVREQSLKKGGAGQITTLLP